MEHPSEALRIEHGSLFQACWTFPLYTWLDEEAASPSDARYKN